MNKVAFDVSIHVCLPREREVFGVGGGIIPYTCMGRVGEYRWGFRTLNSVSFFYLGLILRWGNSSSNGWFGLSSFPFCGKNIILKNSKVLRVVRRKGEFFTISAVFALEGSIEKNCFKVEMIFLLFLYGTKSRDSNGPNGHPAQCMTPSEFYKNRYIQRYWPATNYDWILSLCFCCTVVRRFATGDVFVYLQ